MSVTNESQRCNKCNTRIPKARSLLICSHCDEIKHLKCMKISKSEAKIIVDSGSAWICYDCISSALPVNACNSAKPARKGPVIGPKFKVQCTCCNGWIYSPANLKTCHWCESRVHTKCHSGLLGCRNCCENMIPGYYVHCYQLYSLHTHTHTDVIHNPYDRYQLINEIGNTIDQEQELEYWNEISDILVSCNYMEPTNVSSSGACDLKIFTLNIRGLLKNVEKLREDIFTYSKYDVLCFNETNLLQDKLPNGINDLVLDGFYEPLLRDPIRSSGRGGGLAIYINTRVCEFENIEKFFPQNFDVTDKSGEFMLVKLHNCKGFNKTKIIVNIYRSPASKNPDNFTKLIDSLLHGMERHSRKHIILAGDFNVDLTHYDTDKHCQNLIETMTKYGFFQLVSRPTRITDHSATLIDHVYSNNVQHTHSCNVLTVDLSDHLATLATISLGQYSHIAGSRNKRHRVDHGINTEKRVFNEPNNLKFIELIGSEMWEEVTSENCADEQYNKFIKIYGQHYDEAYPVKTNHVRRKFERQDPKPFMLPWLEIACARKNKLFHAKIVDPTKENYKAYKKHKTFCDKHVNKAKDKYYKTQFDKYKDCSKKQWQLINTLLGRKSKSHNKIKLQNADGNIINSDKDVAEHFNSYFSNIATKIKEVISARTVFDPGGFKHYLSNPISQSMFVRPTTECEVEQIISKLKNKSTQDTKIEPLKIVKDCPSFCKVLSIIINTSFSQGIFPSSLKIAKVIPIHKGGSKSDATNYRPISLLCTFSKLYEKLMHNRVMDFLDKKGSLFEGQYGFRPGRSCEHALLDAQHTILNSLAKKEVALLLLVDFSKAFDVLSHDVLIDKLQHYGIRGQALQWFKSYLSTRQQYVYLNGTKSALKPITYGVPQGSIMGPLLFLIYINDMPNINSMIKFILYADDANIIIKGKNTHDVIQKFNQFSHDFVRWVDCNGLALNLKKTCYMLFGVRNTADNTPNIHIADTLLERKREARFLGVIMDDKLTWSKHIAAVRSKMMRYVGIMYKIKRRLSIQIRLQIYQSFVQSHLNFCSIVWGFAAKNHIESLFSRQKQGIRAVMPGNINYFYKDGRLPEHTKQFFNNNGILTVHSVIVKNTLILMHRIKHFRSSVPQQIRMTIPENAPTANSDHTTAASWLAEYNTTHFRSSMFFKGPLLSIYAANANVSTLPTLFSINLFKSATKRMLLNLQRENDDDTWPSFLLHNIVGLRRSQRV